MKNLLTYLIFLIAAAGCGEENSQLDINQSTSKEQFNKAMFESDLDTFMHHINKTIELDSNFADAYLARARHKYHNKNYTGAMTDLNKTIELDSNIANAHYYRGLTNEEINKEGKALKDYSKAINLNPDFTNAYYSRGLLKNKLESNFPPTRGCEDISKAKSLGKMINELEMNNCKN